MKLAVRGLSVRFGAVQALGGVDLELGAGQVTVLLGPNGAGKSTLMGVLLGLVRADVGRVEVEGLGYPSLPSGVRRSLGYLPEAVSFAENLSGRQVLRFFARAKGLPGAEVETRLAQVGLSAAGGRLVSGYSRGMRQRLGLAVAALGDPAVLILDEPTGGLDQEGLTVLWELLDRARQRGCTVLISTHDLNLVERRSDRVVVMRGGQICAQGSPQQLREQCALPLRVQVGLLEGAARHELGSRLTRLGLPPEERDEGILVSPPPSRLPEVMAALEGLHSSISGLRVEEPGLDRVYESALRRQVLSIAISPPGANGKRQYLTPGSARVFFALAVHELVERARDRWVLMASALFVMLSLGVSLYGRAAQEAQAAVTAPSVVTLSAFLVPLVALILGHDAVVGERERNTLGLLLSLPVRRVQVVLAKFSGRALALSFAALAGLAASASTMEAAYRATIGLLVGPTLLLGLSFLSVGVGLSCLVRRRVTAATLAVVSWFLFVFVYDLGLLLALVLSDGAIPQDSIAWLVMANPAGLYRSTLLVRLVGSDQLAELGLTVAMPGLALQAGIWAAWILLPLLLGSAWLATRKAVHA